MSKKNIKGALGKSVGDSKKKKKKFHSLGELFGDYQITEGKGYITKEFQDYGYRLALELDDLKHKSLYIKLAKQENRALLERARSFVVDAQAKNKGALFMWKLKEMKKEAENKNDPKTKKNNTEDSKSLFED